MPAIFLLLTQIATMLPSLISKGIDVVDLVSNARKVFDENRPPSDPEWDALEATIAKYQARFRDGSA